MRRTLAALAAATSLALGGAIVIAGPAAAASGTSVHTYGCEGSEHPGQHRGWTKQPSPERRNLGGTCLGPE